MVSLGTIGILACLAMAGQAAEPAPAAKEGADPVRSALGKGSFPWYDVKTDAARPINVRKVEDPPPPSSLSSSSTRNLGFFQFFGNVIGMVGLGIALAILVGLLVWFWRVYEPRDLEEVREVKPRGEPSRVESLPEGMEREFATSDPWEEAIRRRNRGDLAGAILCLFAHQLLTLSKLGLVRLAPGRTGRQLVRAVTDSELRALVHPTLRLFEAVYYGHKGPDEADFAAAWREAEAFERRVGSGVGR